MKTVLIKLKNGGYFNGFNGELPISSPHPLKTMYFTYSNIWYHNVELNDVTDRLDKLGEEFKVLEFRFELHEI